MSPVYQLLRQALLARQPLSAVYDSHYREFCPHVIGLKEGHENVLVYQFGGSSSTPLSQHGDWRCFRVAKIQTLNPLDGPWRTGNKAGQPPNCIDVVDVFVPF